MRKFVIFILLFAIVTLSFEDDAEARRRRRRARQKRAKVINEKNLYERIGGAKAVSEIVDEWLRVTLADQRIAPMFVKLTSAPERLGRMRKGLNDQLCEIADGPCQYKGQDMKKAHGSLGLNEDHFLIFSEGLFKSLQKYNVAEREKNELLARFGDFRDDVVQVAGEQ